MPLIFLLSCSDPHLAYRTGINPETPLEEALSACASADTEADECTATAIRNHAEALSTPENSARAVEICDTIPEDRWRAECHFSLAEPLAKTGDRWGALRACGQAGTYYDECLYHAWTFELQRTAEGLTQAVDGIAAAKEVIAWWSHIGTVAAADGADVETLLWRDWWYFAHTRAKPARLSTCDALPPPDQARCVDGTEGYVLRTIAEWLIRPETPAPQKDRLCRSGASALGDFFPKAWEAEPRLDQAAEEGIRFGCSANAQAKRPWNPVFRPRSIGGSLPPL